MIEQMHIANLGFLLNFGDGTTKDEVESELFKIIFQIKNHIHYDREIGGSFENVEQEPFNMITIFEFTASVLESVYRLNEEKSFDPFIVVGANDIIIDTSEGKFEVTVQWRLLQDLNISGEVNI